MFFLLTLTKTRSRQNKRGLQRWRTGLLLFLVALQMSSPTGVLSAPTEQAGDPSAQAQAMLETLTPEERVGQLLLVTFLGSTATEESQIYDLIYTHHIGGVVLRRDMDNFLAAPNTLTAAHDLIEQLQQAESDASQSFRIDASTGEEFIPTFIPLLVATSQEGDGHPYDQILDMLSPQPNAMTLGATWNPDLAFQAGELLGQELQALGINLLLGPSLDVLENPRPESAGDLGVRSFGGDPYWVEQMGRAYIEGVHLGSNSKVAVVPKHLPGHGGSDRPPEEEVPTVRKSLAELIQVELPPFFSVTGEATSPESTADALLLGHIRYQAFQGNISATTRPLSLDQQALSELLSLPAFAQWRQAGGLIISDSLGTRAVRRNYDSTERVFNAPFVARDAFLAGNDMLYLGNFLASGDPDSYTTIVRTAQFFAQKYREDQSFADRVDESVLRVLTLKFKIYPSFILNSVLPSVSLETVGANKDVFFEVSSQAATLFSPSPDELQALLPDTPGPFDQIVFISDTYSVQQCTQCESQNVLSTNALAQAVLRLYGPGTGNQISPANLASFSFTQLTRTLDGIVIDDVDPLLGNLQRAEWVVFTILNEDPDRPESNALRRLLAERPDLIQNKKVLVFSLNAPYYLDATDITKVTAYYGLYSKTSEVADIAARLLFQEIGAPGASPVSVEGVGYQLNAATAPDPAQKIALSVTRIFPQFLETESTEEDIQPSVTLEATTPPTFQAGDLLTLLAGPIRDFNGHIVPDGTPLTFSITIFTEGAALQQQVSSSTQDGFAQANYSIGDEGNLEIYALSGEPPARSDTLHFDVVGINLEGLALQATQTAQAQLLLTPSPAPTELAQISQENLGQTGIVDWFLVMLISGFAGLTAYQAGLNLSKIRWAVRWGLTTLIGGLLVGSYLSFNLPGSVAILLFSGKWGLVLSVVAGCALGWLAGWVWKEVLNPRPTSGQS